MRAAEFLQENNGRFSSMRLMSLELVTAGVFIAIYATVSGKLNLEVIGMVGTLITAGLTGKSVQKGQELKVNGEKKEGSV